jgi:anaerobic magnesium-protoporphyrin IX monomethyl ester cyclase
MKIAFVNPPFLNLYSRNQRSPAVTKGGTFYYPFWLSYACGWAIKHEFKAELFDFVAQKLTHAQSLDVLRMGKFNLIVIDVATPSFWNDTEFISQVKKDNPAAFVMAVGTHPSAMPQETLKKSNADAVAIAEYDQTILEVAQALDKHNSIKKIPGLYFKTKNLAVKTPPREPLSGKILDGFPFVSEIYAKFLHLPDYYFAAARHPMLMLVSARGCPFGCNFCIYWQTLHGKIHRARSAQNVAAEFAYIQDKLPEVKEIVIEDDTFTANIPRVREICKLLIQQGNKLPWSANVRVGVDLETLTLMKQAGCRLIIVGFESGVQKLLDSMGKHAKIEWAKDLVLNAHLAGVLVHGCFMVGNPGETRETMEKTLRHAIRLNCDSAQFYPLFVYPGTVSFHYFENNHLLQSTDYRNWLKTDGQHNTVINLPGLTALEMVKFCESAYLKYYLRPSYMLMKLKQLFVNPNEGIRSIHSAFNYLLLRLKFSS